MMDRGSLDVSRLNQLHRQSASFTKRANRNLDAYRVKSPKVDKTAGLRSDQTACSQGPLASNKHAEALRWVSSVDAERGKRLILF